MECGNFSVGCSHCVAEAGLGQERRVFPTSGVPWNPTLCKIVKFSLFMVVPNFPFQNLHLSAPPTPGGCWLRGMQGRVEAWWGVSSWPWEERRACGVGGGDTELVGHF